MDAVTPSFAMKGCPHCQVLGPHKFALRTAGVHFADVWCRKCDRHWFAGKPDNDATKYRRPQQHRNLVSTYAEGFCEMCLRTVDQLPKGTTLEAQHVREYRDGGTSDRANIWIVCTACHRLIHWARTYHGVTLRNQATEMAMFTEE